MVQVNAKPVIPIFTVQNEKIKNKPSEIKKGKQSYILCLIISLIIIIIVIIAAVITVAIIFGTDKSKFDWYYILTFEYKENIF